MRETHLAGIKCEITEHLGVLSESPKSWNKKVKLVSWNARNSKYSLRETAPIHEKKLGRYAFERRSASQMNIKTGVPV